MSPNVLSIAFALLITGLSFAEARRVTTTGSRVGTLAKGALIAVVVCVVVGAAIIAICCFCAIRIMRRRRANAGVVEAPVKPIDYGNQQYGQQAPYNNTGGYENNTGGYNAQYTTHQGEYNAGYPAPTTYAPPPGAPNMPMPGAGY